MVIFLYKNQGGGIIPQRSCTLQRVQLSCRCSSSSALALVLACGCSSCTADVLAALLPYMQQREACAAQRAVSNSFDMHRRRRTMKCSAAGGNKCYGPNRAQRAFRKF